MFPSALWMNAAPEKALFRFRIRRLRQTIFVVPDPILRASINGGGDYGGGADDRDDDPSRPGDLVILAPDACRSCGG